MYGNLFIVVIDETIPAELRALCSPVLSKQVSSDDYDKVVLSDQLYWSGVKIDVSETKFC